MEGGGGCSHLLSGLIAVEREATAGALHDDAGAQAAQDAGLVVLARVELRHDRIVWVRKLGLASRTRACAARIGEPKTLGARDAEDVAAGRDHGAIVQLRPAFE